MKGAANTGYWNVNVVHDGDYEFRLRRWSAEANTAITAGIKAGEAVPGEQPYVEDFAIEKRTKMVWR